MAAFLFQLELPEIGQEVIALIPEHRMYVSRLFADGRILSYSVSEHRKLIWCVMNAEDEQEAMQLVLAYPLYPYFTEVSCHPLLFHNTVPAALPGISLN